MANYKEILRMASEGRSQRQIAVSVGSSRNTVSEILVTAQAQGITWSLEEPIRNEQLGSILFPNRHVGESEYLEPDFAYIHGNCPSPR